MLFSSPSKLAAPLNLSRRQHLGVDRRLRPAETDLHDAAVRFQYFEGAGGRRAERDKIDEDVRVEPLPPLHVVNEAVEADARGAVTGSRGHLRAPRVRAESLRDPRADSAEAA